ncbi:MAG: 5'-methylthioadenosine/adenosylhomocysteine nucleosidase [Eubacterium sp.]
MIGIIGAMEVEVAILKDSMTDVEIITKASRDFYKGRLGGKDAVVVKCGVGKVNAAVCAQILIDVFRADILINTGIAGSLRNEINIGDIVLATDAIQHDMDATGFGYDLGIIPQMERSVFESSKELRKIAVSCCMRVNPDINVYEGRIVTGDQFISNGDKKQWLVDTFSGYCTEMEGAAIAQTAYLNEVPFLILRAISDKADNSAHMDYKVFEEQAVKHSVNLLKEMIKYC